MLAFQRLWVQIPALNAGWTFFTFNCCNNCDDVCLKRPKINEKEAGVGPFLKKQFFVKVAQNLGQHLAYVF